MDSKKQKELLIEALETYLQAGHKDARRAASEKAKYALKMAQSERVKPKQELHTNALDFELALKELIAVQMQKGLTVTEAVGTLHLCAADITNQFFNPQPSLKDAFN